jgi:hypothetical protein
VKDAPKAVVLALQHGVQIIDEEALQQLLLRLHCPAAKAEAVMALLAGKDAGAGAAGTGAAAGAGAATNSTFSIFSSTFGIFGVLSPPTVPHAFFYRLRAEAPLRARVVDAANTEYERIAGEAPRHNGEFVTYLRAHAPALAAALLAAARTGRLCSTGCVAQLHIPTAPSAAAIAALCASACATAAAYGWPTVARHCWSASA